MNNNFSIQTALLQFLPVAVCITDEGQITFFNEAAERLWGQKPAPGANQWCGSWKLYWPDGRPMAHAECPMALSLKRGEAVRGVEAVVERRDGSRVPFMPFLTLLTGETGSVTGALSIRLSINPSASRSWNVRCGRRWQPPDWVLMSPARRLDVVLRRSP